MGMLLLLILGLYGMVAVGVIMLIARYLTKNIWIIGGLVFVAFLVPTYDIIFTNVFAKYYCYQEPNPKTFVKQKVEYPESIYWEDNVYPGFSKEDRKLMITNYLDGVHLKTMALNGDDGNVYVYTLERPMWDEIKSEFNNEKTLEKARNKYIELISHEEKIYTKKTMPQMNYTITFNETSLHPFARKFLYSDETKIIDSQINETIAYNRRYMRFFYNVFPDVALGNIYYYPTSICGEDTQYFFLKVFQKIHINSGAFAESFNSKLYRKKIKGNNK